MAHKKPSYTDLRLEIITAKVIDPKINVRDTSRRFQTSEKIVLAAWNSVDLAALIAEEWADLDAQLADDQIGY